MTGTKTVVAPQNQNELSVEVNRFQTALATGTVTTIDRALSSEPKPPAERLITNGTTVIAGRYYYVELWRSSTGAVVTIAHEVKGGISVGLVNRISELHAIRETVLFERIAEAVFEAMDDLRIDPHACWQLRDELIEDVTDMVMTSDHNDIAAAAKAALDRVLEGANRQRWGGRPDVTVGRELG